MFTVEKMEKRWKITATDNRKVTQLQGTLKIHPAICKILVQRGIETFEEAKSFYRPELKDLHDPWLMKGMREAVERIKQAFTKSNRTHPKRYWYLWRPGRFI